MADLVTSTSSIVRDQKLASWLVYAPQMAGVTIPLWHAVSDGYGRKVTIIAQTREGVIAKLREYAAANSRKLSPTEMGVVTTASIYTLIGGAALAGLGILLKSSKLGYAGGVVSVVGIGGVAAGAIVKPKLAEEQVVAMPALGTS